VIRSLLTFAAALVLAAPLRAQDGARAIDVEAAPRPEARATRATTPIVLDGVLDEAAWGRAEVLGGFIQSRPDRGMPATESTEARILYDDRYIYVGVELWDPEPHRLVIPSLEQDFQSGNSDIFGITFDTFLDRRNAFMFLVNPKGAVKEAQDFDDSREENAAWEGVFEVRTRIHDRGWTVEWAIPFTTLRFDPHRSPQDWGMQMMRRIRRRNEESYWAPLDQRDRIHRMSKAGTLRGLEGLRAGRNLVVKPFAVASGTPVDVSSPPTGPGGTAAREWSWTKDAGLDVKYGVTSRLTLDLTYRTDFSQVEVDQERVNLTRFSLFFPERRDFFTENSGVFSFGDITERNYRSGSSLRDFTLFHSRRIGLDGGGHEIPIVGGGRLTGRAGGVEIGALTMQTDSAQGLPRENFGVVRAKRTVEGVGDFGVIGVNRQSTDGSGSFNRAVGVEANLQPTRYLRVNTYLASVDDSGTGSDWAGRVWVGWRDPFWNVSVATKRVGEEFDPAVGFVRRAGVASHYATVGVHHRPAGIPWLNEVNPYLEWDRVTDLEGRLLTRIWTGALSTSYRDGGRFGLEAAHSFERVTEPFTVSGQATIPEGIYRFGEAALSVGTSAGRPLSGNARVSRGGFFNGDRTSASLSGEFRLGYHAAIEVSEERNWLDIPGSERFSASVSSMRITAAASTRLFASVFRQQNRITDERIYNLRLNYIHSPLSDLFVVYTRRDRPGLPRESLLSLKVTKALAF